VIKEPLIADFKTRWPALFRTEEVIESFFIGILFAVRLYWVL